VKSKIYKVIQIIAVCAIGVFLIMTIFQKIFPNTDTFFGFKTFVIVSRSMEPKLKVGDVILVKKTAPDKIKINDTISYQGMSGDFSGKIITHQVKNIMTENGRYIFYTKGLKNTAMDPAVYEEQVYGVLAYRFILLSIASKVVRNTFGFIFLIVIPLSILLVTEVKAIRQELKERR
jgi:signal peptidase I